LAKQKVAALAAELEADPAAAADRLARRRRHEAEAHRQRVEAAQKAAAQIAQERQCEAERQRRRTPKKGKELRASTSDAEARIMKMADGGYRPGYNLQFKTDPKTGCIVGFAATNRSSDRDQLVAAVDEIERRYGCTPQRVLADAGYDGKDPIEELHRRRIEVFCPVPGSKGKLVAAAPKPGEGEGVIAWRQRMSQQENLAIYRQRFGCERPHADVRNRGLQRLVVRGLERVTAVALWYVSAYNFLQIRRLAPGLA
jgi:hypothetical protein